MYDIDDIVLYGNLHVYVNTQKILDKILQNYDLVS